MYYTLFSPVHVLCHKNTLSYDPFLVSTPPFPSPPFSSPPAHTHTYIYAYTHTKTLLPTKIHTYTHTHTHTHTHNTYSLPLPYYDKWNLPSARNMVRNTLCRLGMHGRWWVNDPDCMLLRDDVAFSSEGSTCTHALSYARSD